MPKKYQDEIEEILKRSEEAAPGDAGAKPVKPLRRAPRPAEARPRLPEAGKDPNQPPEYRSSGRFTIKPGKLMLAGLVVFFIAALLRVSLGWVGMGTLSWVGLGIIGVAYLMLFIKPATPPGYEKRWRGQALEPRDSAWKRFTRRLKS
jgi:hypothetical protein